MFRKIKDVFITFGDFRFPIKFPERQSANTMISKDAPNGTMSLKYSPIFSLRVWGQGW